MSNVNIEINSILKKLNIDELNEMQTLALQNIKESKNTILLSPTGTGKTLAFLLPLLKGIDFNLKKPQVLIVVPSRELAMQIESVARKMGTGLKINAIYGGKMIYKEKIEIKTQPQIVIGTPGRINDHLKRNTLDPINIKYLVLDEFDKSLEIGFEEQIETIYDYLNNLEKHVLTSATFINNIPQFIDFRNPKKIDFSNVNKPVISIKDIISPVKDKLDTLKQSLLHLNNKSGIVFCNYKESVERVSEFLNEHKINHGIYHGGLDQIDRETVLIKFRNKSLNLIIATDLAARGLDIDDVEFIIHYHLPYRKAEFTHRNGRTARMNKEGNVYILKWKDEELPEYIEQNEIETLTQKINRKSSAWKTVKIYGGRKSKISKGDIVGLFIKKGQMDKEDIGVIEVRFDFSYVGIRKEKVKALIKKCNGEKLKNKKIKIVEI